jgi:hypothetical protein
MRYLLSALAVFMVAPPAFAADIEPCDVGGERCVMQSYENRIIEQTVNDVYVIACMRVAGYEPETGGLTGGAKYHVASGGG